ncbi:low affinity immunoglobulin gamma Fc region receptor II-a-like [Esox lucius]|uniref:low affinity immunoglobulin gamma Fc region receptor II-a-like n=1 Tax=Esox lucius TaxID=8010 RepID=UPI0014773EAC|nr:low affinity immunoglobulin gamma Fc region receptor II-a-like [Esox lucius]
MRYTETGVESGCSPHWGSITGSTCTITSTDTGDSGVYWCESGSGQYSNAVNITVSDGDVILESPAHLVTEGDSLTLRCKCRNQRCTNSKVDFYKDGVLIRNETTGEMTISAVMKSDEGFYKCKSDQIESPESWVTVRVTGSSTSFPVGVVVGPVVAAVLLTIILVLLCRHNIRKGGANIPRVIIHTDNNDNGASAVPEPGDETYEQIQLKSLDTKNKENPGYSEMNTVKTTDSAGDSAPGSGDVTYAQIQLKLDKTKNESKPPQESESVYSQVKPDPAHGP